jgi:hypothetical protein
MIDFARARVKKPTRLLSHMKPKQCAHTQIVVLLGADALGHQLLERLGL